MESYDAIIIGAGPAGLLLAKELSKKNKILVLEKNKIGQTNKNWLTYKDRWIKNKFPKCFIENQFNEWFVQMKHADKKNQIVIKDDFICFDEHRFLNWLALECRKQGAQIIDNKKFASFTKKNGLITVDKRYSANLLIDCTGIGSPLVKKYNLIEYPMYINCYAYIGEFDRVNNRNFYCFYRNKNRAHYSSFGFTKIAPKLAQLQYFKYSSKKPILIKYKKEMEQAIKDFNIPKHKIKELKIAGYPTGIIKKRALDNIIFFGDAGLYSPSLNGMGFNEILRQYKKVARHITRCISEKTYSEKDLRLPDDVACDIDNLAFRLAGLMINDMPPAVMDEMFLHINRLSQSEIRRIMRNTITDKEVIHLFHVFLKTISIEKLIRALQKNHAKYILETIYKLNKNIISEEVHNLFFKHHKIKIKDIYE